MILINSSPKDALKIFQPFLPISVPIGIGILMSVFEKEGIKARFIDEQVEDDAAGLVFEYVKELPPPYIFAFSVLTIAFKSALELAKLLKINYPDSITIFGGIHPSALPEDVLSYPCVDIVCRGEGEKPLLELYRCVKEGKDYTHIHNLSYRLNGQIIHNPKTNVLQDLNSLPPFPYHLFSSKRYDLGFVVSSRGCPYECIFCSNRVITGKIYRYRSSEQIANELETLCYKYNRKNVVFLDDNLLVSKERIYDLLDKIKEKGLQKKMAFSFQARGDNVNYDLLSDLYNGGFKSIFFGLETASDEIMKAIKKGEKVAQCIDAVKMAKNIGFHVSATFVYGFPGETHKDRMDCVRLSKELQLDMVRYNNATPYPGTELYEIAEKENRLHISGIYENFISVSSFIENPLNVIPLSYVPEGSTEKEIRRDILFSYFSFYLDRSRLINIFIKTDRGVGWFKAGEKLVEIAGKMPSILALALMLTFKFFQLFYYSVIHKETAISFGYFLKIFEGLLPRKGQA